MWTQCCGRRSTCCRWQAGYETYPSAYGVQTDLYWAHLRLAVDWSGYGSPGVRYQKWGSLHGPIGSNRWNIYAVQSR